MKKLSEVAKIVGVTRRTLQEYDKIGLLSPTAKTEGGYWLYDDIAISKLITIRTLVELGYERQRIKQFLESPVSDIAEEFDHMISMLKEKRQRINESIEMLNFMKRQIAEFSESTAIALGNIDISNLYNEMSFTEQFEKARSIIAELPEADKKESIAAQPFWTSLIALGYQKNKLPGDPKVLACVWNLYNAMAETLEYYMDVKDVDKETLNNLSDQEIAEGFEKGIGEMLDDRECLSILDQQCGAGAGSFIRMAVHEFMNLQLWRSDEDDSTMNNEEG